MGKLGNWVLLLSATTVLAVGPVWIFTPATFPFFENLWIASGRPDAGTRVLYFGGLFVGLFVLAIRILKPGPI